MKQGGSPRFGFPVGLEGFGCQVHRPHVTDHSSVDQGRGWSQSVDHATLAFGARSVDGGGQGTHPSHGDPLFSMDLVSRGVIRLSREKLEETAREDRNRAVEPGTNRFGSPECPDWRNIGP